MNKPSAVYLGYQFSGHLFLFKGTTTINQAGFINPGLQMHWDSRDVVFERCTLIYMTRQLLADDLKESTAQVWKAYNTTTPVGSFGCSAWSQSCCMLHSKKESMVIPLGCDGPFFFFLIFFRTFQTVHLASIWGTLSCSYLPWIHLQ